MALQQPVELLGTPATAPLSISADEASLLLPKAARPPGGRVSSEASPLIAATKRPRATLPFVALFAVAGTLCIAPVRIAVLGDFLDRVSTPNMHPSPRLSSPGRT